MVGFLLQDDAQTAQQNMVDQWRQRADEIVGGAHRQMTELLQPPAPPGPSQLDQFRQQAQQLIPDLSSLFQTPAPPPQAAPPLMPAPAPLPSNPELDRFRQMADAGIDPSIASASQPSMLGVPPSPLPGMPVPMPAPVESPGQPAQSGPVAAGTGLLQQAAPFLGQPYAWGGKTPQSGFDCSGLAGYLTTGQPESTTTLYGKSQGIGPNELRPGDLVFYNMNQDDMHLQHVGVYVGDGKLVQSGGSSRTVNVSDVNQNIGSPPEYRRLSAASGATGVPAQAGPIDLTNVTQTTAGLSGGGAQSGQIGDRGQQIMSGAADIASWLGEQGQKTLQAILVTEGGLNNARGDSGQSAGPLQFFEGGQLQNFAKAFGLTLNDAKTFVEQHPLEAIQWAIGTPANPGYLGLAIARGIQQNMSGADLATYAQRTGQVSESPERAGQNFQALFGGGQALIGAGVDVGRQLARQGADLVQAGAGLVTQTGDTLRDQFANLQGAATSRSQDLLRLLEESAAQRGRDFEQTMAGFRAPDMRAPSVDDILDTGRGTAERADILARQYTESLGRQPVGLGDWQPGGVPGLREMNPADELIRGVPGLFEGVSQGDVGKVLGSALAVGGALTFSPTTGAAGATRGAVQQAVTEAIQPVVERAAARALEPTAAAATAAAAPAASSALRQSGQASVPFAANLGAAGLGGVAGYATAPEGATQEEKLARAGVGATIAGLGSFGVTKALDLSPLTRVQVTEVENLLKQVTPQQSTAVQVAQQAIPKTTGQHLADVISSNLLSGPGLIWNTLTQGMHLGWQPMLRAAEGHPVEAMRSVQAMLAGVPDALAAAGNVVGRGQPYAGVAGQQTATLGHQAPTWARVASANQLGTRLNLGGDAVMRTLNERMAAMLEAERVVRGSGARTPQQIQQLVQQHAADIGRVAAREGNVSALTSGGAARTPWIRDLSNLKTSLLQDANPLKQAAGILLHVAIPFARVPEELLYQTTRNAPILGNLIDAFQFVKAAPGDAKQTAAAKLGLNGAMTLAIIGGVVSGAIRGPDDLEHPDTVNLGGHWVPLGSLGTLGGRMGLAASIFDGWRKGDNEPEFTARIDNSIKNVLKFGADEYPLVPALKILSQVSNGQYGSALVGTANDLLAGVTPVSSGLGGIENVIDPNVREATRTGAAGIYEPNLARIPGAANLIPARIDPLTGGPQEKPSSGPGSLLRVQNADRPLLEEFARLNRSGSGFTAIKPPSTELPTTRSVMGVEVPISKAQGQLIQAARGRVLANYARVLDNPNYDKMTDLQKAFFWQEALRQANRVGTITAESVALQTPNLAEEVRSRRRVAGRLLQAERRRELELAGA